MTCDDMGYQNIKLNFCLSIHERFKICCNVFVSNDSCCQNMLKKWTTHQQKYFELPIILCNVLLRAFYLKLSSPQ